VNPSIFQFHIILVVKIFSNCKDDILNSLFERIGLSTTILFLYLQEVPSSLCATNTTLLPMYCLDVELPCRYHTHQIQKRKWMLIT
jgi:hypothetical protein